MRIKLKNQEESGSWLGFTDLTVGLLSLFILAFVAMATLKEQKDQDLTRTEQEVLSCQEQVRKIAQERNALLSQSLKAPLESGLIALEDGNIQIQASLLFPTGSAQLTSQGSSVIKLIGVGLLDVLDTGEVIMVAGYTDDNPIRSATYTNWELSAERATTVVKSLIANGYPSQRIFAAGFGEFHPRYPNTSAENRQLNRRVEISVAPLRQNESTMDSVYGKN
ncbi:MAG: OmpA family protein [Fibrobacter sp.]|nr:OmpA family protein [Fibrobacter sp.]